MSSWTTDDGTQINYELVTSRASQEILLLLPGLLGTINTQWRNFARPLAKEFSLIMMDLRGHGRSTNNARFLNPEQMMQDVVGLLDTLNVHRVHVVGYDFGGYLALMLALNQPRRVQSLILHATKFYWTTEATQKMREQLDPDKMAETVPAYADQLVQEHGGRHWRELVRQASDLIGYLSQKGLTENMLAHVLCPVLVSLGDRDELVSLAEAQRLSRLLRYGGLLVLPGVRHPYHSIQPMPLLPMIEHFVKSAVTVKPAR